MGGCSCSCKSKSAEKTAPAAEAKRYVCYQCNTAKEAPPEALAPECCGKKMEEMD
jgi:hypothetical protein